MRVAREETSVKLDHTIAIFRTKLNSIKGFASFILTKNSKNVYHAKKFITFCKIT